MWEDEVLKWVMIFGEDKWLTKDELAEAGIVWQCIPVGFFRTKIETRKIRLHKQQHRDDLIAKWTKQRQYIGTNHEQIRKSKTR
jgi:hypothetical protein